MKASRFGFATPQTAAAATAQLAAGNGTTKPIAGAQSLGPMLNLRLARPERLLDVSMLPELREVRDTTNGTEIGGAITHAEIEDGDVVDPTNGWLREAAANIAQCNTAPIICTFLKYKKLCTNTSTSTRCCTYT